MNAFHSKSCFRFQSRRSSSARSYGPSRLHRTRCCGGATVEIGSIWSRPRCRTVDSTSFAEPSSSCARTAIRLASLIETSFMCGARYLGYRRRVRLLNVLLAIAYAALGLWAGLWLALASGFVCEGNSCSESGTWVDTGEGWQWTLISYLGLASLPVVILAIALTYKALW